MIDLYYWPTPNGHKVTIMLEECGLAYELIPINIGRGEQFTPEFLAISPNNRVPAIVDHEPEGGPLSIFESGAILVYLAEKTGHLMPSRDRDRLEVLQWVFWQMGNLGPMAGQCHHFRGYAPQHIEYAVERYTNEVNRLYGVLERRLASRDYLAGDYSIADIAAWPWVKPDRQGQNLDDFPRLEAWIQRIGSRPAVIRALEVGRGISSDQPTSEEARKILFGQTAATVDRHRRRG